MSDSRERMILDKRLAYMEQAIVNLVMLDYTQQNPDPCNMADDYRRRASDACQSLQLVEQEVDWLLANPEREGDTPS